MSFWTTSRERGPITPRWGIVGVIHSKRASRPSTSSAKNSSWSLPLVITQQWSSSAVLNTVASSTTSPSASTNAPYLACPTASPSASLLNARCTALSASGPRNSHLFSGETSHTATSSRIAAYSLARSPKPSSHIHPPSSACEPPCAAVTSWNAVLIASFSLMRASASTEPHPRTRLTDRSSGQKSWGWVKNPSGS